MGLSEDQQVRILGMPLVPTFHRWADRAMGGDDLTLSVDVLMRISAILGIYRALQELNSSKENVQTWLRHPQKSSTFEGRPPLATITSGSLDALLSVRHFLDAALQGTYMEPNGIDEGFTPYRDDDIRFI